MTSEQKIVLARGGSFSSIDLFLFYFPLGALTSIDLLSKMFFNAIIFKIEY